MAYTICLLPWPACGTLGYPLSAHCSGVPDPGGQLLRPANAGVHQVPELHGGHGDPREHQLQLQSQPPPQKEALAGKASWTADPPCPLGWFSQFETCYKLGLPKKDWMTARSECWEAVRAASFRGGLLEGKGGIGRAASPPTSMTRPSPTSSWAPSLRPSPSSASRTTAFGHSFHCLSYPFLLLAKQGAHDDGLCRHIGGHKPDHLTGFLWSDGSPQEFWNWEAGQPDAVGPMAGLLPNANWGRLTGRGAVPGPAECQWALGGAELRQREAEHLQAPAGFGNTRLF